MLRPWGTRFEGGGVGVRNGCAKEGTCVEDLDVNDSTVRRVRWILRKWYGGRRVDLSDPGYEQVVGFCIYRNERSSFFFNKTEYLWTS